VYAEPDSDPDSERREPRSVVEADARTRTADPFITSTGQEGNGGHFWLSGAGSGGLRSPPFPNSTAQEGGQRGPRRRAARRRPLGSTANGTTASVRTSAIIPAWTTAHGARHARELDRQARLLAHGVEELREGLESALAVDERLELVAEQHVLEMLLEQIERRRFALEAVA
jgi:hypothetical protein